MTKRDEAIAFTVRFPKNDYGALRTFASVTDTRMSEVILEAVRVHLKTHGTAESVEALFKQQWAQFRQAVEGIGAEADRT